MCRLAAVLDGLLIASAQSVRSSARNLVATPFQSVPLLPRLENKMLLALAVLIRKYKILVQREFNRSLPSSSAICLVPPSSSKPAYYRRDRLWRSLAGGGACLRAQTSRLIIAA